MDAVSLSIFANRIDAVCEEMGVALQKAAFSPNIRDRLDYSCAIFDVNGDLCAQAAHIPVHLGSMAFAMAGIVRAVDWRPGEMIVLNDPFMGGTHLPDVSIIAPVYDQDNLLGFVVNRAHHADIGGETPGSMPLSSCLQEEGLVIPPTRLVKGWRVERQKLDAIIAAMRNPAESEGDFNAQIAANRRGHDRLLELITQMGVENYRQALQALNDYAELLALSVFESIPDGQYCFSDVLDDDGLGHADIKIQATIRAAAGKIEVDFSGTAGQVEGNVNCPLSVTAAAVNYVFRCLLPPQAPACAGTFRPVSMITQAGSLVDAKYPSAVAAGNVETSTRIVDVVLGALAQALPDIIPAASHGSMNNIAMGSTATAAYPAWDYYETIGGGMGAGPSRDGLSGVQTHMTNTLNTPVEVLEMNYPLRVSRYQLRTDSGGEGLYKGGDGIVREFEFLAPAQVTVLSERRTHAPWGLDGGGVGKPGRNRYAGSEPGGKFHRHVESGDRLVIETAGGGGCGRQLRVKS